MLIKQEKKQGFVEKALLTYLPIGGTGFMILSYLPQLNMTYSTQNVEGQSLSFWILLVVALGSMIAQQIGMIKYRGAQSYTGLIFQSLNFLLALAMLVAVVIFN